MRPIFHRKADRLERKAAALCAHGVGRLAALAAEDPAGHARVRKTVAHVVMGLGGEDDADTESRMAGHPDLSDQALVNALVGALRRDAFAHRDLQAVDGRLANGMSVMAW